MNRTKLLALLREKYGYKGEDALDAVQKFLTDEKLELSFSDGRSVDDIFSAKQARKVVVDVPADAEDEDQGEPVVSAKANPPAAKASAASAVTPISHANRMEQKAYNARANAGKTAFPDYEAAEQFGAVFRLAVSRFDPRFKSYSNKSRDLEIAGKVAAVGVNATGGALIPDDFSPMLISLKEKFGVARQVCGVTMMTNDRMEMPRRTAGYTGVWAGENSALADQDVAYDNVGLTANKFTILSRFSNEVMNDSAGRIADTAAEEIAQEFARGEDDAYFNGDGSATFGGFRGVGNTLYLLGGVGNQANVAGLVVGASTWATITAPQLSEFYGRLPAYSDNDRAVLCCSRQAFYLIFDRLVRAAGGVTEDSFRNSRVPGGLIDSGRRFFGYPVVFCQAMPRLSAGTTLSALFGDFAAGSKFGEVRGSMQIVGSEHRYFDSDQFAIRATERVAFNPHDIGNASATAGLRVAGPIVGLATG
jgi:HK97 family phage major capsid protein